jgi:excisionase family DNA binding protein
MVQGGAEHLLSIRKVAARLGVSAASVYRLCERGELPQVRVSNAIRITPTDLAEPPAH